MAPIRVPENRNATLWRYMRLCRFEQFMDNRGLWFTRGDCFDDPYEGLLPAEFVHGDDADNRIRNQLFYRSSGYANCWHMSEHESVAMWQLYGIGGVSLKTTFSRLEHAFQPRPGLAGVKTSIVQYNASYLGPRANVLKDFLHKGPYWDHEKEVRSMFHDPHVQGSGYFADPAVPMLELIHPVQGVGHAWKFVGPEGQYIAVTPETLVTSIVLDPTSPSDLEDKVKAVLVRSGARIPVEWSQLYRVDYLEQRLARERLR